MKTKVKKVVTGVEIPINANEEAVKIEKKVKTKRPAEKIDEEKVKNFDKKSKKAPGNGTSVAENYLNLFTKNYKAKLDDKALAMEMRRLNPNRKPYVEADIRTVRSLFNRGLIKGQTSKPEKPLTAFNKE